MKIKGIGALERQLRKNADMGLVKDAVKLNATELHQNAMRDVTVDTGALKRSIMLSMHDEGFTWRIKALINYAPYVEYGTRFQTAQPFIRPNWYKQLIDFQKDLQRLVE